MMIEDILSAHADALNQGVDHTDWLSEQYSQNTAVGYGHTQQLTELLQLARILKNTLVPQSARPEFATQLRADLQRQTAPQPTPEDHRWLMGIAFTFSLVAGWLGWRYWRRNTAETTHPTTHPTPFFKL